MATSATDYRTHTIKRLEEKTPTSKRYEIEGLIILVRDVGFAGIDLEVTDAVDMTIEAGALERALEIAEEAMDSVQAQTGMDDRKEYYYKIKQAD